MRDHDYGSETIEAAPAQFKDERVGEAVALVILYGVPTLGMARAPRPSEAIA